MAAYNEEPASSAPSTPMLRMLAPSAQIPPSANANAWTMSTTAITRQASHGPEQHGGERRAEEVAAGAAGDREVEHLYGEDECGQHAQQRHAGLVKFEVGHLSP